MIRAWIAALLAAPGLFGAETAAYFQPWHVTAAAISPDGTRVAYLQADSGHSVRLVRMDCDAPYAIPTLTLRAPRRSRQKSAPPASSQGGRGKKGPSSWLTPREMFALDQESLQWISPLKLVATLPPLKPQLVDMGAMKVLGDYDGKLPPAAAPIPSDVQREVAGRLPDRQVQILGAGRDGRRFLALAASREEPGRYFLYDRTEHLLSEFARKAPGLGRDDIAQVLVLGSHVLTLPRHPPQPTLPLVLVCRSPAPGAPKDQFERGPQSLAAAGFAVLEVDSEDAAVFWRAVQSVRRDYPIARGPVDVLGVDRGAALAEQLRALHPDDPLRMASVDTLASSDPAAAYAKAIRALEGSP